MSGIVRTVREQLRLLGYADGLIYVLTLALQKLSFGRARILKYYFVAQPVPENAPTAQDGGRIAVRQIAAHDPLVAAFPRPAEVIRRRFANGDVCLVATRDGEFAGFLWLAFGRYMEDEVRCLYQLAPNAELAWDYDVYVVPQLRLGRAFSRLWAAANAYLRQRGVHWTISRISAFNAGSLAAHRRLGTRHLQTALFVCVGRMQLALLQRPPYLHVSFGQGRFPVLRFCAPC